MGIRGREFVGLGCRSMRACSACAGEYEDPDRTAGNSKEPECGEKQDVEFDGDEAEGLE